MKTPDELNELRRVAEAGAFPDSAVISAAEEARWKKFISTFDKFTVVALFDHIAAQARIVEAAEEMRDALMSHSAPVTELFHKVKAFDVALRASKTPAGGGADDQR